MISPGIFMIYYILVFDVKEILLVTQQAEF